VPSREISERAEPQPEAALEAPAGGQAGTIERVIGLQRSIGNRRTAVLLGGMQPRASIARYKILGPWNLGEPVHETLTLLAIKQAKERLVAKGEDPGYLLWGFGTDAGVPDTSKSFSFDTVGAKEAQAQFLRGVVWADDPEGLLFDKPQDLSDYSSGLMWNSHFEQGKAGNFDTLTARSHFGDLQFFHGMASSDKEAPKTTKAHMLNWARFLVNVATGATLTFTPLKEVPEISALFPKLGERTVKELFGWGDGHFEDIRQRAIGALFHMIQDSFAQGHVQRNKKNEIVEFHAYGGQDEKKHAEHDALGGSWYESLGERLKQTGGALSAIDACATVMEMIAEDKSTDEIVAHLDKTVWALASGVKPAGPGAGLGKPKAKAKP
jgi:hypothetical protein